MRSIFNAVIGGLLLAICFTSAAAASCTSYPDTLTNGTTADATQVMADFNYMMGCTAPLVSPSFTTPTLGVATATSINGLTLTSSTGTLTVANGKTVTVSNTLTFTGTDSSSVSFGTGGTVLYTTSTIPLKVGTTTIASGTNGDIEYNNSGVLGELATSGSGNVARTTSPTFTTPNLGTPSTLVLTNATGTPSSIGLANGTGLPISTGVSGLGTSVATLLGGASSGTGGPVGKTSPSISGLTVTSSFTATGLVTNADLANSSMTIAGHSISLGGTQAIACADLSNGATGCSTATGTSGATLPLLNGTNTWSGAQSFNNADFLLKGSTSGALTLEAPAVASTYVATFPAATDTVAELAATQTFTNKRITQRIATVTSGSTITPTADSCDEYTVTALAANATIAVPSGTPTDGQKLIIRIKDNGTARTLTWTTTSGGYRVITNITLPTTTLGTALPLYIGLIYNAQDSYWDVVAAS